MCLQQQKTSEQVGSEVQELSSGEAEKVLRSDLVLFGFKAQLSFDFAIGDASFRIPEKAADSVCLEFGSECSSIVCYNVDAKCHVISSRG
jgi:hypothetical protein